MGDTERLSIESAYAQIVESHHFYLKWRHGTLAGYIVVIGVLVAAAGWMWKHDIFMLVWAVCAIGSAFSLFAWILEYRTRVIYRQCERVARACEMLLPSDCRLYHEFDTKRDKWWLTALRTAWVSHSAAVDLLFWSGIIWIGRLALKLYGVEQYDVPQTLTHANTVDHWTSLIWCVGVFLILGNRLCGYRNWNCWKWIGGTR